MKTPSTIAVLFCVTSFFACTAVGAPSPIVPLTPAELLACLPAAQPKWSMTRSIASDSFADGWLTTSAERDFKEDPQPPGAGTPAPPATVSLYITDTGFKENFKAMFAHPANGTAPLQINQFPGSILKSDEKTITLHFLVKDRFMIEIRATNLTETELKKYARSMDCTKLLAVSDKGETKIRNPVTISRVDEMNPKNNRSSPLYWTDTQRQ